jgi:hypothetical protein
MMTNSQLRLSISVGLGLLTSCNIRPWPAFLGNVI